jgi:hypothetical protein
MPEPRAQRTLVKSPPELWAEVSDLEALARHLGEFGEIRITRLEPETTVAWEGDRACGTVELEPAGWGTKVTITAQLAEAEAPTVAIEAVEDEPAAEEEAPEPLAAEFEPEPDAETPGPGTEEEAPEPLGVEPEPEAQPTAPALEPQPEPTAEAPVPEPRVGFFARLFSRRKAEPVAAEPEQVAVAAEQEPGAVEPEPVAVEAEPVAEPQPIAVAEPEPAAAEAELPEPEPIAVAEPDPNPVDEPEPVASAPESLDGDRVQAILTGVLDDLGSAHHRPFSRG